jgi:hypothetical protein
MLHYSSTAEYCHMHVWRRDPSHQAVRQLEHVVAQADYDELRIAGALLDVVRHDRHVLKICTAGTHQRVSTCASAPELGRMVGRQASVRPDAFLPEQPGGHGTNKMTTRVYRWSQWHSSFCYFQVSPSAASISSITYSGVGRKWWSANTSDSDDSVFSPPDRFAMFFQLFLGGRTLKMMPCSVSPRVR